MVLRDDHVAVCLHTQVSTISLWAQAQFRMKEATSILRHSKESEMMKEVLDRFFVPKPVYNGISS